MGTNKNRNYEPKNRTRKLTPVDYSRNNSNNNNYNRKNRYKNRSSSYDKDKYRNRDSSYDYKNKNRSRSRSHDYKSNNKYRSRSSSCDYTSNNNINNRSFEPQRSENYYENRGRSDDQNLRKNNYYNTNNFNKYNNKRNDNYKNNSSKYRGQNFTKNRRIIESKRRNTENLKTYEIAKENVNPISVGTENDDMVEVMKELRELRAEMRKRTENDNNNKMNNDSISCGNVMSVAEANNIFSTKNSSKPKATDEYDPYDIQDTDLSFFRVGNINTIQLGNNLNSEENSVNSESENSEKSKSHEFLSCESKSDEENSKWSTYEIKEQNTVYPP